METQNFLTLVRDALVNDGTIAAYCEAQFGRRHTVFLDIDEEHPPDQSLYPVVAVTGLSYGGSLAANSASFELGVGCGLLAPEIDAGDWQRTHRGLLQSARLIELVELCVLKALRPHFPALAFTTETGFANRHPLYGSHTTIIAEEARSSRAPRFN